MLELPQVFEGRRDQRCQPFQVFRSSGRESVETVAFERQCAEQISANAQGTTRWLPPGLGFAVLRDEVVVAEHLLQPQALLDHGGHGGRTGGLLPPLEA